MVQIIKDDIKKSIMDAGKAEFLEHGFERASIRNIAFRAGVSKSNIYNYFENKDDLFVSILKPTVDNIHHAADNKMIEYLNHKNEGNDKFNKTEQQDIVHNIMGFVFSNKEDIILLMYQSKGSSHENFYEYIKDIYADLITSWLNSIGKGGAVSRFFIETVASFYINTVGEFVIKGKSPAEAMRCFWEFAPFMYGGWSAVLDNE